MNAATTVARPENSIRSGWTMTTPLILVAALTVSFQAPAPKADGWRVAQPEDGSFSVELPADFAIDTNSLQGIRGPLEQTVLSCKLDGALFTAQAIRSVDVPAAGAEQAAFEHEQKGWEKRVKGRVVKQERVMVGKYPGRDFTIEGRDPENKGRVISRTRMFFADETFYALTVMSPVGKSLPPPADRFLLSFKPGKTADGTAAAAAAPIAKADSTPEEAWRTFLIAMVMHDEPVLRKVTLPAKNLEVLLRGEVVPKDQISQYREQLVKQPVRRLRAGEVINIPGKGKMMLTNDDVSDVKAVILPDGAPVPTRCQKVEGRWKIDARPIIAARQAAAAAAERKAQGR
jgi:hypothetical protein